MLTKKAWAVLVKQKSTTDMVKAFEELFQQTKPLRKLQADIGLEFRARPVQSYLKTKKVECFGSEDDYVKAGLVDDQEKKWKYFHYTKSNVWLKVLSQLMQFYNNTVCTSIKMTPTEEFRQAYKPFEFWTRTRCTCSLLS